MKNVNRILSFVMALFFSASICVSDEGMFPISDLGKINLKEIGLKISAKDLYETQTV
ncbi:MAG: hypothetical protein MZV70_38865 [Desulfobacterales bacterium]|nr:hypothetical protein [Desulfobacterales bacterium]